MCVLQYYSVVAYELAIQNLIVFIICSIECFITAISLSYYNSFSMQLCSNRFHDGTHYCAKLQVLHNEQKPFNIPFVYI